MSAMKASDVDLSKITISSLRTLDNGGKMCFLNYNGDMSALHIQTPEAEIPFDAAYYADNEKAGKYIKN